MQSSREPVYDGYFADPYLARFEGRFWAYGSGGAESERRGDRVFEALHSSDLASWASVGGVLDRLDPALGDAYWAPEVVEEGGSFWMYFSVGHGISGHHLRVARADSPTGPFADQGVNLTPSESFAIDAHPFRDVDGSWYLFYARDRLAGERPGTHLAVTRLTTMTSVSAEVVEVLTPNADWQIYERQRSMYGRTLDWHTLEGPTVIERDGRYHLFFSAGSWEGTGYGVSTASAAHPMGPWSHDTDDAPGLLSTDLTGLPGPGHNSVLRWGGDDLVAFHAWNEAHTKRQMYIERLSWSGEPEDEKPRIQTAR